MWSPSYVKFLFRVFLSHPVYQCYSKASCVYFSLQVVNLCKLCLRFLVEFRFICVSLTVGVP